VFNVFSVPLSLSVNFDSHLIDEKRGILWSWNLDREHILLILASFCLLFFTHMFDDFQKVGCSGSEQKYKICLSVLFNKTLFLIILMESYIVFYTYASKTFYEILKINTKLVPKMKAKEENIFIFSDNINTRRYYNYLSKTYCFH